MARALTERVGRRRRVPRGWRGQLAAIAAMLVAAVAGGALAGEADVVEAKLDASGEGTFRAVVTVRHADEGWEHYADAFEVVAPDGTVLATRELLHPHVDEQPFTRSLGGVAIPADVTEVRVRARDSVHGLGGTELVVPVPGD